MREDPLGERADEREDPTGDDLAGHAPFAAHPFSQELAEDLGVRLREAPTPPADLDAEFAALTAELEQERGPLGRLRSLSTPTRRLALLLCACAVGGGMWVTGPAANDPGPLAVVASLGLIALIACWQALRPLHQPPLSRKAWLCLALLLVLMPLGIAFLPPSAPLPATPHDPVPLKCFGFGVLFASPVLVLALFLHRAPGSVALGSGLLLAAVAAGGVGTICLEGRCPAHGVGHRVGEHATIGVCLAAVLYVLSRARGR